MVRIKPRRILDFFTSPTLNFTITHCSLFCTQPLSVFTFTVIDYPALCARLNFPLAVKFHLPARNSPLQAEIFSQTRIPPHVFVAFASFITPTSPKAAPSRPKHVFSSTLQSTYALTQRHALTHHITIPITLTAAAIPSTYLPAHRQQPSPLLSHLTHIYSP